MCIIVVQKSYARENITAAADLKGLKTCPIFWFFTQPLKNTGASSLLKQLLLMNVDNALHISIEPCFIN